MGSIRIARGSFLFILCGLRQFRRALSPLELNRVANRAERDADVYTLGVDAVGREKSDWICAREFWDEIFCWCGR